MSQIEFEPVEVLQRIQAGHLRSPGDGFAALARAAERGETASALAGCLLLARRFPAADFITGSEKLCALGEYAVAEQLMTQAVGLFPGDIDLLFEQAQIAQRAGDFQTAAARFGVIRQLDPSFAGIYLAQAQCFREAGLLEEAAAVLDAAVQRFPRDLPIAAARAEVAQQRGLHAQATRFWAEAREVFPDWPAAFLNAAKLHRDTGAFETADSLLRQAIEIFPSDPACLTEYAWVAQIQGDLGEARRRWTAVRDAYPGLEAGYAHLAHTEVQLGQFDAAATILDEAVKRFTGSLQLAVDWAFLAERCEHWNEAEQRWRHIREQFPDEVTGFAEGIKVLRQLGLLEEARKLAEIALPRFPDSLRLADEVGRLKQDELEQLRAVFSAHIAASASPEAYAGLMHSLIGLRRFDEIASVAVNAQIDFPGRMELYTLEAEAAEACGELRQAQAIWGRVHEQFPQANEPIRRRHDVLLRLGDFDAADTLVREACNIFPNERWPFRDFAINAESRQDWAEAIRRWESYGEKFNEPVTDRLHDLRIKLLDTEIGLAQLGGDLSGLLNYRATSNAVGDNDPYAVMMTFESLGGLVMGCEFGAVQRAYGAEPLGLLRWSGMAMHTLIDLLERNFSNVGDPETSELGYYDHGDRREYSIKDKTFGFILHTHIFDDQQDEKTVFDQVTRRMKFLRRKLLDDLSDRQKIFLFKNTLRGPDAQEMDRLETALRSYGRNLLMVVTSSNDENPGGSLRVLRDNLWLGYLDFSDEYGAERAQRWLELCTAAHQRFVNSHRI